MLKNQKLSQLRETIYEQAELVKDDKYDYKRANAISQLASQVYNSYKVQIQALSLLGRKADVAKLDGLLDT